MGFGLFQYYWPYWAIWTAATFPGAFIAWYIKKDNLLSAVILSVALGGLIVIGTDFLRTTITDFPKLLLSTLFCFGMVPVLISELTDPEGNTYRIPAAFEETGNGRIIVY